MRWHSKRMINGLIDLCRYIPSNAAGVEIGSFAGESSVILSSHTSTLHCVDPWIPDYYSKSQIPKAEKVFDQVAALFPNIVKHKETSESFLQKAIDNRDTFDFVYIDGNHTYEFVKRDIELSLQVIKKGGMICGHDYGFSASVKKAVDEQFIPDIRFADYSWIKFTDRI